MESRKLKKKPTNLQVNTMATQRYNPVMDSQSPAAPTSAIATFNSQMLIKYGHLKMHLINSQLKNHSQIDKIKELIEKPEIIALVRKFEMHQLQKKIPGQGNYQYEGFSNVKEYSEFKPKPKLEKIKSRKEKEKNMKNVAVAKLLANILKNKVKESYYRPFMRSLPTLKQDIQIYNANKRLSKEQAAKIQGLKMSVQTDFRPIEQEKTRGSTNDHVIGTFISNFTTQQKHDTHFDQFSLSSTQAKGVKKLRNLMKKQLNKKYLDFFIDLQVMSSDNKRPPLIRKGFHNKSPSMAISRMNKLDMVDLDISVIECSDDKEYTQQVMNNTDDNIMKSLSQLRPGNYSTTNPLRFEDEETKEEQEESNQSEIDESIDQEDVKMKEDQQQLKFEIDGFKDELDEFDRFIQEHLNDENMLKELQLHNNASDDDQEEMKMDDTDDLINFGFKDVEVEELDDLDVKIMKRKSEKKKKEDSFELQLGSDDDRMNDFD